MVEWRVFWPYSRHQLNIFDLLKIRSPHNEPSRTDVYYAVTKDVGIKLRCESFLEMKVRNGRDEAGCEQWKKICHDKLPRGTKPDDSEKIKEIILETVKTFKTQSQIEQLGEAITAIRTSDSLKALRIRKERQHSHYGSCSIEQTRLQLINQQGHEEEYCTVSIEGDSRKVLQVLQTQVDYKGSKYPLKELLEERGMTPSGYPEFVLQIIK